MLHFNSIARGYDELYGEEQLEKMRSIQEYFKFKPGDAALDLGCGTGLTFPHIGGKVNFLVAVDFSYNLLKIAKVRSRKFRNVHLILADTEYLPLRDQSFDKIFTITHLQNLPNPDLFLNEISRISKSGAEGFMTVLKRKSSLKEIKELFSKARIEFNLLLGDCESKDHIIVFKAH